MYVALRRLESTNTDLPLAFPKYFGNQPAARKVVTQTLKLVVGRDPEASTQLFKGLSFKKDDDQNLCSSDRAYLTHYYESTPPDWFRSELMVCPESFTVPSLDELETKGCAQFKGKISDAMESFARLIAHELM
jgi:hypothetical protein